MKALLALALAGSFVAVSHAGVFDLATSFPDMSGTNPNGPWSYRTAAPGLFGPDSSLFETSIFNGVTTGFYNLGQGPGGIAMFRDIAGNTIEGVPGGEVGIRTGEDRMSGFRFTFPEAGPVVLNGSIGGGSPGNVDIVVAVNGFTVSTTPNVSTDSTFTFTSPVDANVGDFIEVFVGRSANATDSTRAISASVQVGQPVPEPATLAAMGLGGLTLLCRRKKSALA